MSCTTNSHLDAVLQTTQTNALGQKRQCSFLLVYRAPLCWRSDPPHKRSDHPHTVVLEGSPENEEPCEGTSRTSHQTWKRRCSSVIPNPRHHHPQLFGFPIWGSSHYILKGSHFFCAMLEFLTHRIISIICFLTTKLWLVICGLWVWSIETFCGLLWGCVLSGKFCSCIFQVLQGQTGGYVSFQDEVSQKV